MNDLSKDSVAALEAGYAHVCQERDALKVALDRVAHDFKDGRSGALHDTDAAYQMQLIARAALSLVK